MTMTKTIYAALSGMAIAAGATSAGHAQGNYVVGISAGLTGYATTVDRAWVDGAKLAADRINAGGGLLGKQIKIIVEDNRSEPQEAVSAYRKMLSADGAQVFVPGCLSAGNFAAAPIVVRQKIPMIVCSILPNDKNLEAWMYSMIPRPAYEVESRLAYLRDKTQIRNIGVIYDQSPYAGVQQKLTMALADKYGIKVVGSEQYQQTDADFSVVLKKLYAEGARAILKMGLGPSSVTIGKNIRSLGLDMKMLASTDDMIVLEEVAKVLDKDLLFVASPTQVYNEIPESDPIKKVMTSFVVPWRASFGTRDPLWGGRGYDAMMVLAEAVRKANSFDGEKVRDALNGVSAFQGTSGVYNFSADHNGVTANPYVVAQIIGGKLIIVK